MGMAVLDRRRLGGLAPWKEDQSASRGRRVMTTDRTIRPDEAQGAISIESRLSRSVRFNIWRRFLWRFIPAALVYLIFGTLILEAARRSSPISGVLQSPSAVLLVSLLIVSPLIILSARHALALAINVEMAHLELLGVLSSAIAKRDNDTEEHNLRVAVMAVHLAIAVGLDRRLIPGLFIGALLHDVGKIGVPDSILLKPGKLSPAEQHEMERHVIYGDDILPHSTWFREAGLVVHFHHERIDGSGYPEGRRGTEIPAQARLFAVVDAFDALTSNRPYRQPIDLGQALLMMERERSTHFDSTYLDAFNTIAETLFTRVVCTSSQELRELALGLIEKYYALVDPRRIDIRKRPTQPFPRTPLLFLHFG